MDTGAILTRKEVEQLNDRLTLISRAARDIRVREACRLTQLTIKKATRRSERFNYEKADIINEINDIITNPKLF